MCMPLFVPPFRSSGKSRESTRLFGVHSCSSCYKWNWWKMSDHILSTIQLRTFINTAVAISVGVIS